MIKRRMLVGAAAASLFARPHAAPLGGARGKPRIGRLSEGGPPTGDPDFKVFRAAMRDLGHAEVVIENYYAQGQREVLRALAAELVRLEVDVIWVAGTTAAATAKNATTTIPIVMVSADAVRAELVSNLARPGGNLTGLTLIGTELVSKRLELMTQLYPAIKRVIALCPGPGAINVPIVADWLRQSEAAASKLRLPLSFVELSGDPNQWDNAFASFAVVPGTALSPIESPFLLLHRALFAELALKHRLPAVYAFSDQAHAGGLCSYGLNARYITERVAFYVARILNGAKPGDLPVEQPTKYELLINLKTAKALGITIPKSLLLRADEVIQ